MKKGLLVFFLLISLPIATVYAERRHDPQLSLETAQKQAYWYGLFNIAHLTMFSGLGDVIKSGGMTGLIDWLRGGGVKKAELIKDMTMIKTVYASGVPYFVGKVSLKNKKTMQWDRKKMDRSLEPSAHAFTIIKSVAKNFHRDYHETEFNQRVAIAMYPEAKQMAKALVKKMLNSDGLFVAVTPKGRKKTPGAFDQVAVLWAFSDLALVSSDPELPPYNDEDLHEWAVRWADRAFQATRRLPPHDTVSMAIAIEAYARYGAVTENPSLRAEAIKGIKEFAERIKDAHLKNITEMALTVYALTEAYRITGNYSYMKRALKVFNEQMESLWDVKAGVYANTQGLSRYEYSPFDVGSVLAALNSILWFALPSYKNPQHTGPALAAKRYVSFFENAVVLSGLQQSSGLYLVEPIYLKREPRNHFVHPTLPDQSRAGGKYGIAPVYAGRVVYEKGRWRVVDRRFKTADAMFLSVMSVILNRHNVDCFVPVDRLLHKLINK